MSHRYADIAFTQDVKSKQTEYGSRENNDRLQRLAGPNDLLGLRESHFIEQRDTFYMATTNQNGWPYVQHRGGPKGFLRVLDPGRLAFADFRGNTQLISSGNVEREDRCSLILVDYPNRKRLKIFGHVSVVAASSAHPELISGVALEGYAAKVERIFTIDLEAFDWNCPQHITPRYTVEEMEELPR